MKALSQSSLTLTSRFKASSRKQRAERWSRTSVLSELRKLANPKVRAKTAYFGVKVPKAYGISQPVLHGLARRIGKSHELAEQLWSSGNHEARILATLIGEPDKVTARQMERWAREFDSWDIVDAVCCYLYAGASGAWRQVESWSRRREEFVKRAAFSLVAYLSRSEERRVGKECRS